MFNSCFPWDEYGKKKSKTVSTKEPDYSFDEHVKLNSKGV